MLAGLHPDGYALQHSMKALDWGMHGPALGGRGHPGEAASIFLKSGGSKCHYQKNIVEVKYA